jgi:plastocyanin
MAFQRLASILQSALVLGALIFGLLAVPVACNSKPPAVQIKITIIEDYNEEWRPSSITTKAGGMVTWVNNGHIPHAIISDQNLWADATISPGETFSYTFLKSGSFSYHDETDTYNNSIIIK